MFRRDGSPCTVQCPVSSCIACSVCPTHLAICHQTTTVEDCEHSLLWTTQLICARRPRFLLFSNGGERRRLDDDSIARYWCCATPTTVAKNDTHWNLINRWIEER